MTGNTRDRILQEATRQLLEHRYDAFTMASVQTALGLSSGSMFHAFDTKAALAAAVFVEGMADYQTVAIAAIEADTNPDDSLRALISAHLGWVEDNPALARFLFSTLPDEANAEVDARLVDHNSRFYAALDGFYDRAVTAGLVAPLGRTVAHPICIGPAQEYCRQWLRGNIAAPPREHAGALQTAALAALASTTGSETAPDPPRESEPITQRVVTHRGVVRPYQMDHMGHLNVMHYVSKFDEASWQFFGMIGLSSKFMRENDRGMAAVEQQIIYQRELHAGDLVHVKTAVMKVAAKVITFRHYMIDDATGETAAHMTLTAVHLDTAKRKSCPLPPEVIQRATNLCQEI